MPGRIAALVALTTASLALGPAGARMPAHMAGDTVVRVPNAGLLNTVHFLPDGDLLMSPGAFVSRIGPDGTPRWSAPISSTTTRAVVVIPGADAIAVGSDDGIVRRVTLSAGKPLDPLPGQLEGWISDVAVSADGREIAAVTLKGDLGLWRDGARITVKPSYPPEIGPRPAGVPSTFLPARLEAVAFAPDGALVIAGNGSIGPNRFGLIVLERDGRIRAIHGQPMPMKVRSPNLWIYGQALAFSPDGRKLALGYWGGGLELLAWPSLKPLWRDAGTDSWVEAIRWHPEGHLLWSTSARHLRVHRATDGHFGVIRRSEPNHALDALDLSPDGRRLALAPRSIGVVLLFPPPEHIDWRPPRVRPGTPVQIAVPPPRTMP